MRLWRPLVYKQALGTQNRERKTAGALATREDGERREIRRKYALSAVAPIHVEQTLAGNEDNLKERTLGVEVFHRTPDYDTNLDPVVRLCAGEVRKRIAQYYQ